MSIPYTDNMEINDWNNDEIIRLITAKGHITQKKLLEVLNKDSTEKIPQSTFSSKIRRNTLKVIELQKICSVLGYSINIEKING